MTVHSNIRHDHQYYQVHHIWARNRAWYTVPKNLYTLKPKVQCTTPYCGLRYGVMILSPAYQILGYGVPKPYGGLSYGVTICTNILTSETSFWNMKHHFEGQIRDHHIWLPILIRFRISISMGKIFDLATYFEGQKWDQLFLELNLKVKFGISASDSPYGKTFNPLADQ